MAENDSGQEKTEAATPRRRQSAREEGQVPKSAELNTTLLLTTGVITFYYFSKDFMEQLADSMIYYTQQAATLDITEDSVTLFLWEAAKRTLWILAPFFVIFVITAIVINIAQVGFTLNPAGLQLKFNKLNPINGIKNLFSARGRMQLARAMLMMLIIAPVIVYTVYAAIPEHMSLVTVEAKDILIFMGKKAFDLAKKALVFMLIFAIIDYVYQRWQFEKDLKMSKEEVKQEMKDSQGDPKIKQRIRSIQQEMSRKRMMQKVPEAEVVVTNPTEYAIALKYNPEENPAPVVIAKGKNLLAQKIKGIAIEHDIPIVENKPLAQSLYKLVEVGGLVPPDLYQAVAEVLAYVYKLTNKIKQEV